MADGITPYFNLTLPEVGANNNAWGPKLNYNFTLIDTAMKAVELGVDPINEVPAFVDQYAKGQVNYFVDAYSSVFVAIRDTGVMELARDTDDAFHPVAWTDNFPAGGAGLDEVQFLDANRRLFGVLSKTDGRLSISLDPGMVHNALTNVMSDGLAANALAESNGDLVLAFDDSGKPITACRKLSGKTYVVGSTVYMRRSSGQEVALGTFTEAIVDHQAIDDERAHVVLERPNAFNRVGLILDIYGNTPSLAGPVTWGIVAYGQSGAASHQADQLPLIQPTVFPTANLMARTSRNVQDTRCGLDSLNVADELTVAQIFGVQPLNEELGVNAAAGQSVAAGVSGVMQNVAKNVSEYPMSMLFGSFGVGSQPLSTIADGTPLGNSIENFTAVMKQTMDALGHRMFLDLVLDHGEAANGSQYFGQLQTLRAWLPVALQALTTQARRPLIGHAPNCSYTGAGMIFAPSQATKFLRWSETQVPHDFRIISTQYQYFARAAGLQSCTDDLVHKNKLGQLKLAQMFAHMLVDEVLLGKTWKYPFVDQITHAGQVVTVRFGGLDGDLEDYTVANGGRPAEWLNNFVNGNLVIRSSSAVLPITNISQISGNELEITVTGAFSAIDNQLRLGNATHAVGNLQVNTVPTIPWADNGWERECLFEPGTKLRKAVTPVLILFPQSAVTPITFNQHYGT